MTNRTQNPDQTKGNRRHTTVVVVAFLTVVLVWFLYPTLAPKLMGVQSYNELAGMFGGLEALFAGLAFAGVIVAIFLQMEELRQTREEMERSADALTEQVQLMAQTAEITERTAVIMSSQTGEMKRATHAAAFKSVFDILQAEDVRAARGYVINHLAGMDHELWGSIQVENAEKVIYTYDAVGVMIRNGMLPANIVVDHWGNSLRKCWPALEVHVLHVRKERSAKELFDDFEWLAGEASAKIGS